MKKLLLLTAMTALVANGAAPSISNASITQAGDPGCFNISYTLNDGPAFVTADVFTNGAAVGLCFSKNTSSLPDDATSCTPTNMNGSVALESGTYSFSWNAQCEVPGSDFAVGDLELKVKCWPVTTRPNYLLVDLERPNTYAYFDSTNDLPYGICATNDPYRSSKLLMRYIPAKGVTCRLGNPTDTIGYTDGYATKERCRYVKFTNDYYMSVFEFTEAQFSNVFHTCSSRSRVDKWGNALSLFAPMQAIDEGQAWFRGYTLSATTGWPIEGHAVTPNSKIGKLRTFTGLDFDLPTSEQWEFACRAGTGTACALGADKADLKRLAWYNECGEKESYLHPVGLKEPNQWGLYDMHGNSFEMVLTRNADLPSEDTKAIYVDPVGASTGSNNNMVRGGCFEYSAAAACSGSVRADSRRGLRLWLPVPNPAE